jgi:hypothetical protein
VTIVSKLTKAVFDVLSEGGAVTPRGAAYALRNDPTSDTTTVAGSLEWLARNGLARKHPDKGFGPEYTKM